MTIDSHNLTNQRVLPSQDFTSSCQVNKEELTSLANQDRLVFWEEQAKKLDWFQQWDRVLQWEKPFAKWFLNGKLNACYNCVDRHLKSAKKNKNALIWQAENGEKQSFTYADLHSEICKFANVLVNQCGVKVGDRVTLYMPLIPQLLIAVLACARIGAIHSVVFAGFSAQSLKDRIIDSQSVCVITSDGAFRRGKHLALKSIVDEALSTVDTNCVRHVLVHEYSKKPISLVASRDMLLGPALEKESIQHEPTVMDSEDPLFILYTSGTTGKPKGILHTTGGYLTHAQYSTKAVFDINDDDLFWCTADIGWITGHTYLVYGPLLNGSTVFMYEGTPDYPDNGIFWRLIEQQKITIFYTAPTAIRSFMKAGESVLQDYDLSSLRLLGSVGEPINPEAWMWYYTYVGYKKCPVVDTWWQTETGGIMISTLPGQDVMKPGAAGKPLPGIQASCLNQDGTVVNNGGGLLSLTEPWPSMARGIWGDNQRFKEVYWSTFDTYFAGDGAVMDEEGYITVLGRVDDVLNVSGHRIGTMEVESSLVDCPKVAEAAVVGIADSIKGQAIMAFVTLKEGYQTSDDLIKELKEYVVKHIGAIARPKDILFASDLPKTRSGKIIRRILKQIVANEPIGDTTSLANPSIVDELKSRYSQVFL